MAVADRRAVLPTFLFIGAAKCGSSWIFEILREHPQVFVPVAKDLQFFDRYYHKGLDWYLSFFEAGAGVPARGELSHNYFLAEATAARIRRDLPGVRLLCCLRNPVDRTVSAWIHARALGLISNESFEEYAFLPETMQVNRYHSNLVPFVERFATEGLVVLFYDDLRADPAAFAGVVYGSVGVDPGFVPDCLRTRVLPARTARSRIVAHAAYGVAGWMRALGLANLVGRLKRTRFLQSVLYSRLGNRPRIPPEVRRRVAEAYLDDHDRLARLIGRPVPSGWYSVDSE